MMDKIYDVKNAITDIFYGLWANMLSWKVYQRAMLVLFLATVIFGLLLLVTMRLFGKLLKTIGKRAIEGIFLLWQSVFLSASNKAEQSKKIQNVNRITEKFSLFTDKVERFGDRLTKFRIGKIRYYLIFYVVCIFLIGLPDMLSGFVNEKYSHIFSFGQTIYCNWESGINQKARAYEPIIGESEEEPEHTETEESAASQQDGVWLRLSGAGIEGTNIRSGPGVEYESIGMLSGEVRMLYVNEQGKWCCVELEDGTQGWINSKLLERIE